MSVPRTPSPQECLDALDRAARYYREALRAVLEETFNDRPRTEKIREAATTGIRAADYELRAALGVETYECPEHGRTIGVHYCLASGCANGRDVWIGSVEAPDAVDAERVAKTAIGLPVTVWMNDDDGTVVRGTVGRVADAYAASPTGSGFRIVLRLLVRREVLPCSISLDVANDSTTLRVVAIPSLRVVER